MKSAIKTSEESWIEQQMLEDKKRATDWEATNEAIEEQVARESYLQWLQDQEKQARQVQVGVEDETSGSVKQQAVQTDQKTSSLSAPQGQRHLQLGNGGGLERPRRLERQVAAATRLRPLPLRPHDRSLDQQQAPFPRWSCPHLEQTPLPLRTR